MSQCNPGRAKREETAKNDEADKQEMENKNGVCQESIDHEDMPMHRTILMVMGGQ